MSDLKKIKDEFLTKLKGEVSLSEINQIKSDLFGKNGIVSSQFKKIGTIKEFKKKKICVWLKSYKKWITRFNQFKNKKVWKCRN